MGKLQFQLINLYRGVVTQLGKHGMSWVTIYAYNRVGQFVGIEEKTDPDFRDHIRNFSPSNHSSISNFESPLNSPVGEHERSKNLSELSSP